ncbi:MAG: NmrA family NAD(P)-binding protein [Chitinophagaceae bacterium]|nr:NmrA family NAD(P)-binding protein [Chitinophagaceae bacterium]
MKITVTGSLGHISRPLTEKLVKAGHQVTVISSSDDRSAAIEALGAKASIGSAEDASFLTRTFTGADAVYTMVPPNFGASEYRKYITSVGQNYAQAIQKAGVKSVVNLSCIGAHLDRGTGPIAGLHDIEEIFNKLENVSIKHLRTGFFYVNFYNDINMIKHMNIMGNNYGADTTIILVHPKDVADAAAEAFANGFTGKSIHYVASDKHTAAEIASVLGAAVGKPDLKWVEFSDQQSLEGMEKAGMPKGIAESFNEMGAALRTRILWDDYEEVNPPFSGKIKLEDFAVEFAGKY